VEDFCEHGNEASKCIKIVNFLTEWLSTFREGPCTVELIILPLGLISDKLTHTP
jgi:hypothetical protein